MKYLSTIFIALFAIASCKKEKKSSLAVITTTTVASVTSNSAQTGGSITDDGGSQITKKGVCWATHANPTVADSVTNNGTGIGSFTTNLAGLSANTTYFIKAYAINATGTAYGDEVSFKTATGLATIKTLAISNIVALSANGGGEVENDGGAAITERGVVYATTPNPTSANFKIGSGTGTGSFTVTLSPLASQQTYYVRAYAINNFGTAYGNQVQFNAASANTMTDVDGNVYPYVTIGTQDWMATNLKVTKYKNGDPITNGFSTENFNWGLTNQGAYTFPNGDAKIKDTFGLFYNVYAVIDSRGICPTGWHVPTDAEWTTLITYVNNSGRALLEGGSSGLNLQKAGEMVPNTSGPPDYYDFKDVATYKSSTSLNVGGSTATYDNSLNAFPSNPDYIYRSQDDYAASVRCIKN
jgi:uncharacterized protein (TIGR02145 family)